jgi:hypothetical protein
VFDDGEECGELYEGGYAGCLGEEGRRRREKEGSKWRERRMKMGMRKVHDLDWEGDGSDLSLQIGKIGE